MDRRRGKEIRDFKLFPGLTHVRYLGRATTYVGESTRPKLVEPDHEADARQIRDQVSHSLAGAKQRPPVYRTLDG